MREKLTVPPADQVKIVNRIKPQDLGSRWRSTSLRALRGQGPAHARMGRRVPGERGWAGAPPDGNVTKYSPEMHMAA